MSFNQFNFESNCSFPNPRSFRDLSLQVFCQCGSPQVWAGSDLNSPYNFEANKPRHRFPLSEPEVQANEKMRKNSNWNEHVLKAIPHHEFATLNETEACVRIICAWEQSLIFWSNQKPFPLTKVEAWLVLKGGQTWITELKACLSASAACGASSDLISGRSRLLPNFVRISISSNGHHDMNNFIFSISSTYLPLNGILSVRLIEMKQLFGMFV